MPDYSKGQIYKIVDTGFNKCYIGSTIETLPQRMAKHRYCYTAFKKGKKTFITSYYLFDEYGVENCKILWIENYPCNSKKELEAREGYHQQNTDCVNRVNLGRTGRQYYYDKQEELLRKQRERRENNPEKTKEQTKRSNDKREQYKKEKYECQVCGAVVRNDSKYTHEKSNKHQQYLLNKNNPQE